MKTLNQKYLESQYEKSQSAKFKQNMERRASQVDNGQQTFTTSTGNIEKLISEARLEAKTIMDEAI